jgi:hypothetical protein
MPFHQSVRKEQYDSHRTNFYEILSVEFTVLDLSTHEDFGLIRTKTTNISYDEVRAFM